MNLRLLTAADVAKLPTYLPTGDVRYELHDGQLVILAPSEARRGRVQALLISHLFLFGEQAGFGDAYGRVGVLLRRNPDHLLGPDAAFLTTSQFSPSVSPEDYLLTAPALVVEIRSKNDRQSEIDTKVSDYLAAGVQLVWIADPDARTVTAHQPGATPVTFGAADTLTAGAVIPGFAVLVGDLLPA